MNAHCFPKCGNPSTLLPVPPDPWSPVPIVPPTPILNIVCPVIPTSVIASTAAPFKITVNGTLFTATTQGTFDGTPMPSTVVSTGQLWFEIDPAAYLVGMHSIGVTDGGVIGATSCPFEITSAILVPTLTKISPDVTGYYDSTVTTYTGTNFDSTSVISRGAIGAIPTTFVNSTTLTTAPLPANATVALFEIRVRNGTDVSNYKFSNNMQASIIMNPGLNVLQPATAPISGGPITVEVLGTNFGMEPTVMLAGTQTALPTVKRSGGWLDVELTPPATPGTVVLDVRLGHAHADLPPINHDNIRPSTLNTMYPGMTTLTFQWT